MSKKMPKTEYRDSRVCRILCNPTAYQVVKLRFKQPRTPTELAGELGLSRRTVADVVRTLRNIDLVGYEVKVDCRSYRLKRPAIVEALLNQERLVKGIRIQEW